MTVHTNVRGNIGVTLRWVGCIDCATERGMAYFCCDGARCEACHLTHRGTP